MFTGPVGPVEVYFYWPEAVFGNFYWPGAIGSPLASSPEIRYTQVSYINMCRLNARYYTYTISKIFLLKTLPHMYWAVLSYFYTYNICFLFPENLADNDEEFKHKSIAFMSRSEQYSLSVKKAVALVKRIKELDLTDNRDVYWFRQYVLRQ